MFIKTLTVSALNNYVKKNLDVDFILRNVHVEGEISNLKIHSSGHIYFSLKDNNAKINCVMFRDDANLLEFTPAEGMKIIAKGRVTLYEKEGSYQFYCNEMNEKGLGELYIEFLKLKKKLESEGLFESEFKKPIPKIKKCIGVVTSPTGAAVRDIINVSKRRQNNIEILISPCLVQGEKSAPSVIKALKKLNTIKKVDVIIIARGGGAREELWPFNNEELAREIFKSKKPVITGIGHETDFTIADFISDMRAPTPSAAAEIAVLDKEEFKNKLINCNIRLNLAVKGTIENKRSRLEILNKNLQLNDPKNIIINEILKVDNFREKLDRKINNRINNEKQKLAGLNALLSAHNPLNVLNKGYSIIENENGEIITSSHQLSEEKEVKIRFKHNYVKAKIDILEELQ